ncbi:MAG: hypothetical protein Q7U56_05800, partial [Humidesulfovibrio sp.]|nr:hypothetical protein [Humidesulfovibrio sp.]
SLFGDGSYSGNVIQGGSVLQPQASFEWKLSGMFGTTQSHVLATYYASGLWDGIRSHTGCWISAWPGVDATAEAYLPGVVSISKYVLKSRGDNAYNRSAGAWRVEGLSASGWVVLDTRSGMTSADYGWYVDFTGTLATPSVPVSKIRLVLTAMQAGNDGYFEVGEMELYATLQNAVVVTGAATVAPDGTTGASVVMCDTLILDGASASLKPSINSKGLIVYAKTRIHLLNGAKLNIDRLGKAGDFGNLTAYDLTPAGLKGKLSATKLGAYTVLGEGAAGAAANTSVGSGLSGTAAGAMRTGGGGSGVTELPNPPPGGKGGKGGPCCGGAGGGGHSYQTTEYVGIDAGDYGGPGGNGATGGNGGSGGAGDPVGNGAAGAASGEGAGGGLLMLFTPSLSIASGCIVSADGARAGASGYYAGASAGGGCVCIVTLSGGYSNNGTVRASGGEAVNLTPGYLGGPGGVGSVNLFTVN